MVVADSGGAKLACLAGERAVSRPVFDSNGHDAVKHVHDFRGCKPEIAMSPVFDQGEQAGFGQLRQMSARGLRRNPCSVGKFGGRESAAIEKCRKHGGSGWIANQPSYFGDEMACN